MSIPFTLQFRDNAIVDRPVSRTDDRAAFDAVSPVGLQKMKAMLTGHFSVQTLLDVQRTSPRQYPKKFFFRLEELPPMIDMNFRDPAFGISFSVDLAEQNMWISSVYNETHDRLTGRKLTGLAVAMALAHDIKKISLQATNIGALFWAASGWYADSYGDNGPEDLRHGIMERLPILQHHAPSADIDSLRNLSLLRKPEDLWALTQYRQSFTANRFDMAAIMPSLIDLHKDEDSAWETGITVTQSQALLVDQNYLGELSTENSSQMDRLEKYSKLSVRALAAALKANQPTPRAKYSSTPVSRTARPQ